jgi:hypothetical protein
VVPLWLEDEDADDDAVGSVVVTETICPLASRTVVTVAPSASLVTVVVSPLVELVDAPPLDAEALVLEAAAVLTVEMALMLMATFLFLTVTNNRNRSLRLCCLMGRSGAWR